MSTNRLMTRHPVGIVWQTLLTEVFSTLARLERLSRCRNSTTRRYYHETLVNLVAEEEIHPTLVDCHRLIWKEWIGGTLEQQHADLLLYLCQPDINKQKTIHLWRIQPIFLEWVPDSADPLELVCFQSNFGALLGFLGNEFGLGWPTPTHENGPEKAIVTKALRILQESYDKPDFNLASIAGRLHVSSRHLGRLFRRYTGKSFREYLCEMRMQRAAHLLSKSDFEIKTVVAMSGYSSRSHFGQDFRGRFGCTPAKFRELNADHPSALDSRTVRQTT